jgi:2-dehydropantoate 2-reductase
MNFSYAIIGTGGIGGLRSDYDHVKSSGLEVKSKDGDFHLQKVNAYRSAADMPPCDVALVCLKAVSNSSLQAILPAVLKADGFAVVMENGLGVEDEAARSIGPDRVMGGLCFICSHKIAPGVIHHIDFGSVKFADYAADHSPRGVTPRMQRIFEDFKKAGVAGVELSPDLQTARWQKLVWNIPFNGLCITLDTNTRRLMESEPTRKLARTVMIELIDAACALGHGFSHGFADTMLDATARMLPYQPSMKLDFDAGKPTELEYIFGNPVRLMKKSGIKAPLVETLYREIRYLTEAKLLKAASGKGV